MAIGSGGNYALAAARALWPIPTWTPRRSSARRMAIAAEICVYTNPNLDHRDAWTRRNLGTADRGPRDRFVTRRSGRTIGRHMTTFSPREIVSELDRYIVGQNDAKRAVAIALRNRWRRQQLDRADARRGAAEEHPDDRPDRRRQDRDLPAAGQARRRAVPQGRGDQVHRGRLCRPRRRADHPRPRRDRHRPGARREAQGRAGARPIWRPRSGCSTRWSAPRRARPRATPSARSCAPASSTTRRSRSRSRDTGSAACPCSRFPACPARQIGVISHRRHARQGDRRQRTKTRRTTVKDAYELLIAEESRQAARPGRRSSQEAIRQVENNGIVFLDEIDKICAREGARRRRRVARRRAARPAAADRGHDGARPSTGR